MQHSRLNVPNRTLYHGDNLDFMRALDSNSVHLIATDPPFNKGRDFHWCGHAFVWAVSTGILTIGLALFFGLWGYIVKIVSRNSQLRKKIKNMERRVKSLKEQDEKSEAKWKITKRPVSENMEMVEKLKETVKHDKPNAYLKAHMKRIEAQLAGG